MDDFFLCLAFLFFVCLIGSVGTLFLYSKMSVKHIGKKKRNRFMQLSKYITSSEILGLESSDFKKKRKGKGSLRESNGGNRAPAPVPNDRCFRTSGPNLLLPLTSRRCRRGGTAARTKRALGDPNK
jgi:hypothetical protein